MKTVGKQLQDARLEKGWSPELAARETKIRVDRLHDLESDDYSNFSSPTYARGFVRTYARALGMDEYKILRQLDNKLPEDDNASFANDGGVPYMPEPSRVTKPFEVGKGVYIAAGVGTAFLLLIGFILVQVYRAGYFAQALPATASNTTTNSMPVVPDSETAQRALPADSNAPPVALPIDTTSSVAAAPAAAPVAAPVSTPAAVAAPVDTNAPLRALPVDPAALAASTNAPATVPAAPIATASTNSVPSTGAGVVATAPAQPVAPVATSDTATVAPSTATTTTPLDTPTPPRAQPVDPSTLSSASDTTPAPTTTTVTPAIAPVAQAVTPAPEVEPRPAPSTSARQSNARPVTPVAVPSDPPDAGQASAPAQSTTPSGPIVADNTTPVAISVVDPQTPSNVPTQVASQAPSAPPAADNAPAPSSLASAAPPTDSIPVAPVAPAAPDSAAALTGGDNTGNGDVTPSTSQGDAHGKRLVLTASQDSFVRVVALDGSHGDHVRFSSMLHSGQSISFNDRKYTINVGDPAVVDISLDGINYGPHSDHSEPDTFTVESRQP
jgi:cytoskeletal protein RodZ